MASIMPYYNDLALYTDVPNSIGEDNLLPTTYYLTTNSVRLQILAS